MAWYLNNSPLVAVKYIAVNIPASTTNSGLPLRVEWEIEFEARKVNTEFCVASSTEVSTANLIIFRTGTDLEIRTTGNANWTVNTGVSNTQFTKIRIRTTFDGTTRLQQVYINDGASPVASRNPTTENLTSILALFAFNTVAGNRVGDLKYFKFTDFVTPANNRNYDANASGGVGDILPEIINGVNGTQAGAWPADNSEWVFYSSGATYQLTALGGTFTYSGQTAALNRGFKLAAQGGTYSYTGASANLSYTTATVYRLDALGASYSYAGASASLLRGFKLAANGGVYSYAGASADLSVVGPTFYRLTALGVTYVYSGADAALTATGVIPAANPAAFVNRAYVGGSEVISAQVGGRLTNSAKIGGSLTNNATVAI